MREVADELSLTTSTVSQQLAALAREVDAVLVEPVGRRVRLTPAGRRLADHAVTILAAVEAAQLDLDPEAETAGVVRVGGFATAIRRSLLPVVADLAERRAGIEVQISEYEPLEALEMIARDDLDLALVYDYNLAPVALRDDLVATELWSIRWGVGTPQDWRPAGFAAYADSDWIVNSRNTADEDAVRTLASMAGFHPRIRHRIDSLDLVADLIHAGHGVGLLPLDRPTRPDVQVQPLEDPPVVMRSFAVVRRGRHLWSPLRAVLDNLVR